MTHRLMLALLATLACAGPLLARDAGPAKVAVVGQVLLLKLPGDRDAGYRWRFNKARSSGLDLVTVKEVGWTIAPKRKSFFHFSKKPSIMSISVMPNAPGRADLAFDYFRLWGGRVQVKTTVVRVVIKPATVAAR